MEFLGRISTAVVSSTNFVRRCQWRRRRFVITANKMTPSFVPCGIPPLSVFQSANVSPMLTAWLRPANNPAIQLIILGDTSSPLSSSSRILCSIRSKPLEKPVKNKRAPALPLSVASYIGCKKSAYFLTPFSRILSQIYYHGFNSKGDELDS